MSTNNMLLVVVLMSTKNILLVIVIFSGKMLVLNLCNIAVMDKAVMAFSLNSHKV